MHSKTKSALKKTFDGVGLSPETFNMEAFHRELQSLRNMREDVSMKEALEAVWGPEMTPEKFYRELDIDMKGMTVDKLLNTTDMNRWLFPEIFRDAIRKGLEYTPFYSNLVVGEETLDGGPTLVMPQMDLTGIAADEFRLRDVAEGGTIPEAEVVTWSQKQVTVRKKARGLLQTYESIKWVPINLAAIYFEEVGVRLGADLDAELINIALNGDQADNSQSSPVIGAAVANTLAYTDIARAWIRFQRIGRNSAVMLTNEADAITILNMSQFEKKNPANGVSSSGVDLNVNTPLPSSQDIYVHDSVPAKKIIFVDTARAFVQLTAMPLLIESEQYVRKQIVGEFVSIITGFANIFRDGRLVLDYATNLSTNPGPTVPI